MLKIDGRQSGVMTLQRARLAQDKNVQSVFSEVLQNAGRVGYASAEVSETTDSTDHSLDVAGGIAPLADRVQASWDSWYRTELLGRYASKEAPADLGDTFGNVLAKAYDAGAYIEPKSFLKSLSEDELKAVQNAHWLADGIQVDSLTEEGALNLLIPPAAQVDLNRDGLTQSGAAYGIRFPDSTTPATVTAAWEQATDGMPFEQRMIYELEMKLPVLFANFITDADGRVVSSRAPGHPDFVNPMTADDYSYVKVTQDWMEHLDYFKNQIDPDRYARDMDFWTTFQQDLRDNGAA
ncbi:hypothetical protein [Rubripirellula reticaptiva]|uniref:Uncharacterized protein n=1 Tax=Rubripirellula reticaptiva TaxID=2528013 RepID=A0A5C6ESZ9_9BACT|nr:hypothetical protein [Rubripirellula reticaptiva]TWU51795.1 hypothetical protein Poly59_33900 [Rubripirellula reticaptiva]